MIIKQKPCYFLLQHIYYMKSGDMNKMTEFSIDWILYDRDHRHESVKACDHRENFRGEESEDIHICSIRTSN